MGLSTPTLDNRRCDRCAAAGQRGTAGRTLAPHWDPAYRMCVPCAAAVESLLAETGTRPRPDGDGWVFPTHPAHTGAPHFLWRPEARGFSAQVADHAASGSPGAPAGPSPRAGEPGNATGRLSAPSDDDPEDPR